MRIIVRLDLKEKFVIKPIQFEGLRKIGNPKDLAKKYYNNGADELILINIEWGGLMYSLITVRLS